MIRGLLFAVSRDSSAFFNYLSQRFERGGQDCDQIALGHLLWDLQLTSNVSKLWPNDSRFSSRFVSTVGGLTRMERQT